MKFLIDGQTDRINLRMEQWPEGVAGQLLTPLTRYKLRHEVYGIDNGSFSSFNEREFRNLLRRNAPRQAEALFVAIPDKVGCHRTTLELYEEHKHLAEGWRKAFVAQDGFDGAPACAEAIFVGGTTKFKDSDEVLSLCKEWLRQGLHVHIGRVNGPERFIRFHDVGAHTCDGSGVSKYDHMLLIIRDAICARMR